MRHLSAIAERFERTCRDRSGATAVYWFGEDRGITFGELHDRYEDLRRAFQQLGIGTGACVIALVGNHPMFFPLLAAALDIGAALLPLGEATDAEAIAMIGNAGAAAIVTGRSLPLESTGSVPIDGGIAVRRLASTKIPPSYGSSVVIKLTSGSTDLPKAAVAGEPALANDTAAITACMGVGPADVNLGFIPLSHAYAIGNIVVPLLVQGTAVALRPAFTPAMFVQDVERSGGTVFPGVPYMFDRLRAVLARERLPDSLRLLVSAGARLEPDTVRWFHTHAGRKIHSFYGTSETGGITFDDTDGLADVVHVGRPLPGVSVDLRPEPGVMTGGRVFVRAGGMASGYAPGATAEAQSAFEDGGFRTGDIGYVDASGQLVLTGRVSPLINVAGRKVDPAEIERVLTSLPDVAEARVVGVECSTRGQELVAFVVRGGAALTPLGLRRSCADTLSPYKIPRRFIFLERWPVDERGKVDRRALEALAQTPE